MNFAMSRHLTESTLFAVIVGLLIQCVQKRGAATRHALWLMALAKFVLPIALFSTLGAIVHRSLPPNGLQLAVPESLSRALMSENASLTGPSHAFHALTMIWLWVWTAGSIALFAVWLRKLIASMSSLPLFTDLKEEAFLSLRRRIGLRGDVKIQFSDTAEPALLGLWRPLITIPHALATQLSAADLESVILHELAHAKRKDNWTGLLAHAVVCVFWFHPLLWWIEKQLNFERELACDEMVIGWGAQPENYVAGILKVCRFGLSQQVAGVSGVSNSNLKNRMEVIMSLSSSKPVERVSRALLGSLIAMMTVFPVLIGAAAAGSTYGQAGKMGQQAPKSGNSGNGLTCVFASVSYPEGTVIREGSGPEQMCAGLNKTGDQDSGHWIRTNPKIRERSRSIVRLPEPKKFFCTPKPATDENICACEEPGGFSQGSEVFAASGAGRLRCDKGKWVPIVKSK